MVGEYEIATSHVYVYLFAVSPEVAGAALDMPSWPSFEGFHSSLRLEARFPEIITIRRIISFPESEIADTFFFVLVLFHPCPGLHAFHIQMSEIPVVFETPYVIVD